MKLQTCFKNFAPSKKEKKRKKEKKIGQRFCLELCKLMKFEAICTSTKQLVRIWFGTFETLRNL
jgi:coproporphyrinogen III oxidase-like Fe-S oxidoreductase